jgi:hypothetical protein
MDESKEKDRQEEYHARLWRFFHLSRAVMWLGIIPVSYFLGWVYSVAFVAACSLYANAASDVASWRSDTNPQREQLNRIERKLDELLRSDLRDGQ